MQVTLFDQYFEGGEDEMKEILQSVLYNEKGEINIDLFTMKLQDGNLIVRDIMPNRTASSRDETTDIFNLVSDAVKEVTRLDSGGGPGRTSDA